MEETKTYELGLLLTPLLTEEGAIGLMSGALEKLFDRLEIKVSTADTPKMIPLAYIVRKRIDNKNQVFREAYFVSVRFSASPEAIPTLTAELRKISEVIRFLVIIVPKVTEAAQDRRPMITACPTVPETVAGTAVANQTSQKAVIDQEIDDLLAVTTTN